ncbi:MAG: hypothetical protein ABI412_02750 [Sphingomicrobium sp.]
MSEELLKRRIEELANDAEQRDNAVALLSALDGTALAELDIEDISVNSYTNAICIDWLASGEWDSIEVQIYPDHFETYLSRNLELRINHWPSEGQSTALEKVVEELLAGMES